MKLGRTIRRAPGQMNRLEAKYAAYLDGLRMAGQIGWWEFDAVKLRLAEATFYTPDFLVTDKDGVLEVHEVKGFWEDDARVKIKVAAAKFPFRFKGVTLERGQWVFEEFTKEAA